MKQKFLMPTGETIERDMPLWKTPWNHDTNFESDRTATYCADESLTKQEFVEEQDINVIMDRLARGGEVPNIVLPEHFVDLSGRTDYFTMQTKLAETNAMFYRLDADLRSEFLNNPAMWADAVITAVDQGDADQLEHLGIELTEERKAAFSRNPQGGSPPATPGGSPAPAAPQAPPAAPPPGAGGPKT